MLNSVQEHIGSESGQCIEYAQLKLSSKENMSAASVEVPGHQWDIVMKINLSHCVAT